MGWSPASNSESRRPWRSSRRRSRSSSAGSFNESTRPSSLTTRTASESPPSIVDSQLDSSSRAPRSTSSFWLIDAKNSATRLTSASFLKSSGGSPCPGRMRPSSRRSISIGASSQLVKNSDARNAASTAPVASRTFCATAPQISSFRNRVEIATRTSPKGSPSTSNGMATSSTLWPRLNDHSWASGFCSTKLSSEGARVSLSPSSSGLL